MNLLKEHLDIAVETPDGIAKLRGLILTLAAQGKLVAQDHKDQSATELLKSIKARKKTLIEEGKIKNGNVLPPIPEDDLPYRLPEGWEWVRLGDIAQYNGRVNAEPGDISPGTWVLDLEDIEKDTSRILNRARYSDRQSKSTKSTFAKGDVLYGKLRPYLNKVVVADHDGVCTTEIVPIVPFESVDPYYLKYLLKRPSFISYVNSLSYGVKMPRLGTSAAVMSIHPLAPTAEQKRIVAKIDQLMSLCDKLEAQCNERDKKRLSMHAAAMNRLLTAPDKPAFNRSRNFITKHFDELCSVTENVLELKKAILQLAVMGKLVQQDTNDQPASELLKEIGAEKKRLVMEGKIKAQKPLPPIKEEEIPFQLPKGWEWVRLGEIGTTNIGLTYSPRDISDDGTAVLRANNIQNGKLDLSGLVRVTTEIKPQALVEQGDLLICARNGSRALVGKTALIPKLDEEMAFGAFMAIFRSSANDYVLHFINSPIFRKVIDDVNTTTINQITQSNLRSTMVPLPPLNEQRRIVAKIEQLTRLCDNVETALASATKKRAAILDAVLARV